MAAGELTGYWKGLAVSRRFNAVVQMYLEQNGSELSGKFESPDLSGAGSTGQVTGSVDGEHVTLNASDDVKFRGRFVGGTNSADVIYGTIRAAGEAAVGTLTLFHELDEDPVLEIYSEE